MEMTELLFQFFTLFSTWNLIRTLGITAYVLFFLALLAGTIYRMELKLGKWAGLFLFVHQNAGWVGFLFAFAHAFLLLFDTYQPFTLMEILIPFSASYEPIWTGFGTLAFFLLAIVLYTSDWMGKIKKRVWKWIHFLVFPAYLLLTLHGWMVGTDTETFWGMFLYGGTFVTLFAFLLVRMLVALQKKGTSVPEKKPGREKGIPPVGRRELEMRAGIKETKGTSKDGAIS